MFKTRIRKIFGDVWVRRGRTILVSISIFIGVWGTITMFSMRDILVNQLNEDIQEDELAMVALFLDTSSTTRISEQENARFIAALEENVEGLTTIEGAILQQQVAFHPDEPGDDTRFDDVFIFAYSEAYSELQIEPPRLLDDDISEWPDSGVTNCDFGDDVAGVVAIEQRMGERYGLDVCDTVTFRMVGKEGIPEEKWGISGLVFQPYFGSDQHVFATYQDALDISGLKGFSAYNTRFVDFPTAEAELENLREAVRAETSYLPIFNNPPQDPENNQLIEEVNTIAGVLIILALSALVVSGFLVINVISSLVVEQRRIIGVMKSIGATQADNFFIFNGIAFAYGLIGVIPGVFAGVGVGYWAAATLGEETNLTIIDSFTFSPLAILIGIAVGLAIPVLASIPPVFFGTRVTILQAMTDLGIDVKYGSGPMARFIHMLPIPITVRQGLSNVSLKKGRLSLTVITLTLAAGAFMGILSIFVGITTQINDIFDTFNIDIAVVPVGGQNPNEIRQVLESDFGDDIDFIAAGATIQIEIDGYEIDPTSGPPFLIAYGLDTEAEEQSFEVELVGNGSRLPAAPAEGSSLADRDFPWEIVITEGIANQVDKEVGDSVLVSSTGEEHLFTVVGIAEYPFDQAYMHWETLSRFSGYVRGVPQANTYVTTLAANGTETLAWGIDVALLMQSEGGSAAGSAEGEAGDQEEAPTLPPNSVFVAPAPESEASYSMGDTITLTTSQGQEEDFNIIGVLGQPGIPLSRGQLEQFGILPNDLTEAGDFIMVPFNELMELEGIDVARLRNTAEPVPQAFFIKLNEEEPTAAYADDRINEMNDRLIENGITANFQNFPEFLDLISNFIFIFQVVFLLASGLIAAVGALGLLTTLSMSVFERQKEIGIMRSIGAGSWTIATQFLVEGMVVGLVAWLLGLPFGFLLKELLARALGFGESVELNFEPIAIIAGLVGMILITIMASILPSFSAARKHVSDILRYQ